MTSHLSVSSIANQPGAAPASGAPAGKGDNALGAFGGILDGVQAVVAAATGNVPGAPDRATAAGVPHKGFVHVASRDQTAAPKTASDAGKSEASTLLDALQNLLGGGTEPPDDGTVTVPLTATTAVDATANADASDAGTPPKLLHDLVSALTDLDKAEQSGAPVDKDLLKRVKQALDALSNFLAAQQGVPPPLATASPDGTAPARTGGVDPVAALSGALPGGATAPAPSGGESGGGETGAANAADGSDGKAAIAAARTTLGRLADKIEALSATVTKDDPALAAQLETLTKTLDPKTLPTNTLAELGLAPGGPTTDPDLAAAINGLVDGKPQSPTASQPVFAAPVLKLPKGEALTATPATDKSAGVTHSATKPDTDASSGPTKPASTDPTTAAAKPDDAAKPTAAVVGAATHQASDKPGDPPAATVPGTPATTAASAVATPLATTHPALRQVQDAYQSAAPAPVNLPQMAFEIVRHAQQGSDHFQIRLDPADMGRVDVRLAVDGSGSVSAHLTVERSETLDLLKRDAGALGQALTQAGLDGSKTNLQFSLSQNPFARQDGSPNGGGGRALSGSGEDADGDPVSAVAATTHYRGTAMQSAVNIFV